MTFDLITRDLQEVLGTEDLQEILTSRSPHVYWGTAPTGKPHVGYLVPILKIADFLKAGCKVTILFADMHAYLDNMKSTWEQLHNRTGYYEFLIKELFKATNTPIENLVFAKGTDFQLQKEYTLDMYKLSALVSTRDTKRAGAEVVKQLETPKMSGLLYPMLQALDEQYLDCDIQFGGVDQRKIFVFTREYLPKLGYKKRIHLMNPLIPGLGESGKMSSSEPNSKIDFTDTDKQIQKKISKAFCQDGKCEGNGLLALSRHIIFKQFDEFVIERPEQYGGNISFNSADEVHYAFREGKLSSIDLKSGVAKYIVKIVAPIREKIEQNKELYDKAYEGS